ncbi:MAG: histidine phosphatase family protein [Pseudonocardiaceae bacterium]
MGTDTGLVVLLRGLPGVGKSTVANLLRDRLAPAVRVNEDTMRYLALPRDLTVESVVRAQFACADLARAYAVTGANAIVDGVLGDRAVVEAMVGRLRASGLRCRVFTVTAGLEDLLRRNAARDAFVRLPDERIIELFEEYDENIGELMATEGIVPEETADNVMQLLDSQTPPTRRPRRLVLFLRHGAADVRPDRYPDHAVIGLSDEGRAQVLAAREALARLAPTAVVSSPLPRALATAHLLDEVLGLGVEVDPRLAERTFPAFHERPYTDIAAEWGQDTARALLTDSDLLCPEGAETIDAASSRVMSALRDWTERAEDRLLVVSHGGPHGWLLAGCLGLPGPGAARRLTLGHARLTCLRLGPPAAVVAVNIGAEDLAGLCSGSK